MSLPAWDSCGGAGFGPRMELHDPHLFIVLAPELAGHDCNIIQGTVGSA